VVAAAVQSRAAEVAAVMLDKAAIKAKHDIVQAVLQEVQQQPLPDTSPITIKRDGAVPWRSVATGLGVLAAVLVLNRRNK
jgi:hypothetical protein